MTNYSLLIFAIRPFTPLRLTKVDEIQHLTARVSYYFRENTD